MGGDITDALLTPKIALLLTAPILLGLYDSTVSIIGESLLCKYLDTVFSTH